MNAKEKAEQYAHELYGDSDIYKDEIECSAKDYIAGHNEAKRWIPISEHTPPEYEPILLFNNKWVQPFNEKGVRIGFYIDGVYNSSKRFFDIYEHRKSTNSIEDTPTHWREI